MSYFKVSDKSGQLQDLRLHGWVRGKETGLKPLDEVFSLVKGYPLYWAGEPGSGKTEIVLEIALNTSVLHGWKHFVYLGEGGDIEEVIAELCFKYICKPYKLKSNYGMSDSEKIQAEMFIEDHFIFLDDTEDLTLSQFYATVAEAEKKHKIKFDMTIFDPFNDAVDESNSMGGMHHWLNRELRMVKRISKENKRIDVLINHVADIAPTIDKDTGKAYKRPALPDEWYGGRVWRRRGFTMMLSYIPPAWLNDDNGIPYGENVSLRYVQKAKPKGAATYGGVAMLNWNWKYNRYYWQENGIKKYAFMTNEPKIKQTAIVPNEHF